MSRGFGLLQRYLLSVIGNEPITFKQILNIAYPVFSDDGKTDLSKWWLGSSNCSPPRSLRRALAKLCDLDIIQIKGGRPHRYCLHRLFAADAHNARLIELSYRCLADEEGGTLEAKNAAGRAHLKKALDKLASENPSEDVKTRRAPAGPFEGPIGRYLLPAIGAELSPSYGYQNRICLPWKPASFLDFCEFWVYRVSRKSAGKLRTPPAMETVISTDQDATTGRFLVGNNVRGNRRQRIERLCRDIAGEFEGGLDGMRPSDRLILERACTLLLGRPKSHWDQVRATNSAARLLAGLRKRLKPPKPPAKHPSMASLLANRETSNG